MERNKRNAVSSVDWLSCELSQWEAITSICNQKYCWVLISMIKKKFLLTKQINLKLKTFIFKQRWARRLASLPIPEKPAEPVSTSNPAQSHPGRLAPSLLVPEQARRPSPSPSVVPEFLAPPPTIRHERSAGKDTYLSKRGSDRRKDGRQPALLQEVQPENQFFIGKQCRLQRIRFARHVYAELHFGIHCQRHRPSQVPFRQLGNWKAAAKRKNPPKPHENTHLPAVLDAKTSSEQPEQFVAEPLADPAGATQHASVQHPVQPPAAAQETRNLPPAPLAPLQRSRGSWKPSRQHQQRTAAQLVVELRQRVSGLGETTKHGLPRSPCQRASVAAAKRASYQQPGVEQEKLPARSRSLSCKPLQNQKPESRFHQSGAARLPGSAREDRRRRRSKAWESGRKRGRATRPEGCCPSTTDNG